MSTPLRDLDRVQTATQIFSSILQIVQMGPMPQNLPSLMLVKAYLQTINEPAAYEYLTLVNSMVDEINNRMQQQQQQQQQQMMAEQQGQIPTNGIPPEQMGEADMTEQLPLPTMEG